MKSRVIRMRNPSVPLVNYVPGKRNLLTLTFISEAIVFFAVLMSNRYDLSSRDAFVVLSCLFIITAFVLRH